MTYTHTHKPTYTLQDTRTFVYPMMIPTYVQSPKDHSTSMSTHAMANTASVYVCVSIQVCLCMPIDDP